MGKGFAKHIQDEDGRRNGTERLLKDSPYSEEHMETKHERLREDCILGYFGVCFVGLLGHFAARKASMRRRLYVWVSWVCGLRAFLAFCLTEGTCGMVPALSGTSDMSACLTHGRKCKFERDSTNSVRSFCGSAVISQ